MNIQQIKLSGFSDEISDNVTTQFSVLNKLGVNSFDARVIDGKGIEYLTDADVSALKFKMQQYNISVSTIASRIGKVKLSADFGVHFENFKHVISIANKLNARYVRVFGFLHESSNEVSDEDYCEIVSRLRKMTEYAKANNIVLLCENDKDTYLAKTENFYKLIKELYCENFKAIFDFANFVLAKQDTVDAYTKLRPYIAQVHCNDASLADNTITASGLGDGNFEYILTDLLKNDYNGTISIEPYFAGFEGLDVFDLGKVTLNVPKSGEGTFTLAYNAVMKILNKIQ